MFYMTNRFTVFLVSFTMTTIDCEHMNTTEVKWVKITQLTSLIRCVSFGRTVMNMEGTKKGRREGRYLHNGKRHGYRECFFQNERRFCPGQDFTTSQNSFFSSFVGKVNLQRHNHNHTSAPQPQPQSSATITTTTQCHNRSLVFRTAGRHQRERKEDEWKLLDQGWPLAKVRCSSNPSKAER